MRSFLNYLDSLLLGIILGMVFVALTHSSASLFAGTAMHIARAELRYQVSASIFSVLPITAAATQLPTTFIRVRPMSIIVSTPRISRMGAVGRCTALAVASKTTNEARGTPAIPLLAA